MFLIPSYCMFLPPANEVWGKVMFYTCLSFCSQGEGVVSQHALQVVSQHALQQGRGVCYPSMPCSGGVPGPGGGLLRGGSAPGGAWWPCPSWMATAAGGTHPTGMHSCFKCFWRTSVLFVGPLIRRLWTSVNVCSGFQSQGGSLDCILPFLRPSYR